MQAHRLAWPREQALALLAAADTAHFALLTDDGAPMLRCLHVVVDDGALCFHASPRGTKSRAVGRPAVAAVERVLAVVPSYAFDPERACPATTWYESVQVHGTLERVEDRSRKARILQALMRRLQPEGGHAPIEADSELYRRTIAGLDVLALPIEHVEGRAKVGPASRRSGHPRGDEDLRAALDALWRRGELNVDATIAAILDAGPRLDELPAFLRGPDGVRLTCRPRASEVDDAVELVRGEYWNTSTSAETLRLAHLRSPVWIGARDEHGRLIATARASSDGAKHAWIYDVGVASSSRGKGVGKAVMRLLLDHPRIRDVCNVHLQTRDAGPFYATLGFEPHPAGPNPRWVRTRAAPVSRRDRGTSVRVARAAST